MSNFPTPYVYPDMQIVWMRGQSGNNGYWLPGQDQGQGQQRWTLVPGLEEEVTCGLNVKYGSAPTGPIKLLIGVASSMCSIQIQHS